MTNKQLETYRKALRHEQIRRMLRDYATNVAHLEEPEDDDATVFHLCVDLCLFCENGGFDARENFKEAIVHVFPREMPPKGEN